jgi:hypothetical protein
MGWVMDKRILQIVEDLAQWKGNAFTLAALVAEKQREIDREKVEAAGYPEAAEVI